MIPIRDVIPSRTSPKVTVALLVANVLVWLGLRFLTGDTLRVILTYGLTPAHFSWGTATTSLFMHVTMADIVSNMLGLWVFGGTLEDRLGHARFLAFYLLAGLGGTVIAVWASPGAMTPMIGAGAAVAGLMGGYLALFPRSRVLVLVPLWRELDLVEVPAFIFPGLWLITQTFETLGWFNPLTGGASVSVWGLAGGAALGILAVWFFRQPERQRVEWWGN